MRSLSLDYINHYLPVFSIISFSSTNVLSLTSLFSNSFRRSSKLSNGCVDAIEIKERPDNDVLSFAFWNSSDFSFRLTPFAKFSMSDFY